MPGAIFGEVGVWLFVAGAAFRGILGPSRSAQCCIFSYKMRLQDRTSKVSEAAGARWRFYDRIIVGLYAAYCRFFFYWEKQFTEFPLKSGTYRFRGRRSILVRLEADCGCSAHCKWRFICEIHFAWHGRRNIWWTFFIFFWQGQHFVKFG